MAITTVEQSKLRLQLEQARSVLLHAADNNVQGAAPLEEQIARFLAQLRTTDSAAVIAPAFGAKPAVAKPAAFGAPKAKAVDTGGDIDDLRRDELLDIAKALGYLEQELKGKHVGSLREMVKTKREALASSGAPKRPAAFGAKPPTRPSFGAR